MDEIRNTYNKKYRQEHKLAKKDWRLKHDHGITLEAYNNLFIEQQGLCLGCKRHQSQFRLSLAVDHDHKTGKIRGLLCSQCNTTLGLIQDNIETLCRLADYIRQNR